MRSLPQPKNHHNSILVSEQYNSTPQRLRNRKKPQRWLQTTWFGYAISLKLRPFPRFVVANKQKSIIGTGSAAFCSHKLKTTKDQSFCREPHNTTGLCTRLVEHVFILTLMFIADVSASGKPALWPTRDTPPSDLIPLLDPYICSLKSPRERICLRRCGRKSSCPTTTPRP